jgi:hypothetical protein
MVLPNGVLVATDGTELVDSWTRSMDDISIERTGDAVDNGDGSYSFNVDLDGTKRVLTITLNGDELVSWSKLANRTAHIGCRWERLEFSSTAGARTGRSTGSSCTSVIAYIHPDEYGIAAIGAELDTDGAAVRGGRSDHEQDAGRNHHRRQTPSGIERVSGA